MKAISIITFLLCLAIIACHRKSMPVITERKTEPPVKQTSVYPPAMTVKPDTAQGRILFTARCGRCHALPYPSQFTAARWDGILTTMVPRARLDNNQTVHVQAYVMANAKRD